MIFLTLNKMIEGDWITFTFIIIIFLLGVAKTVYKGRLFELLILFFSKEYLLNYGKEKNLIINGFNILLFTIQTIIFSFIVFALFIFYRPELLIDNSVLLFLKIILGFSMFFLIRFIIGKLLGHLFEVKQSQETLTFTKTSYLYSISLLILPLLLFVFYIKSNNLLVYHLLLVVFTILLIVRCLLIFYNNKKNILSNLFYFILYLCALEIAPLLLIIKILYD